MDEILAILRENNALLKEIKNLLLTQMGENDYSRSQDLRQFYINVAADIFVNMMEEDKELRDKIRANFKVK